MKAIAYICSYEQNYESAEKELSEQKNAIQDFCKSHDIDLVEIHTETSFKDDFKPILLNIMSTVHNNCDGIIMQTPDIISRNKDFRDWVTDEFKRLKTEIIFTQLEKTPQFENKSIFKIKENIKNIPSLPEIITKSIEIMQDENTSAEQLAKIISNDIGLTARVLKLVNSSYYGFPKQISTIRQAITILGFTTIKGIIISASVFKIFSDKDNNYPFNYKNFWKHSLITASTAKKIAEKINYKMSEDIFTAAFLHNIGKIILARYDKDNYAKVLNDNNLTEEEYIKNEEKYCGLNHCEIGNLVAYSWNLPEIFCDIIRYHHTPQKSTFQKECYITNLADLIAKYSDSNKKLNIDNITSDILEKINISDDNVIEICEEMRNVAGEISDIDSFFN